MNTKEQYKHLLNFGANLISLLVEAVFLRTSGIQCTGKRADSTAGETGQLSDFMCCLYFSLRKYLAATILVI